jgi:hypothetical protein
MGMKGIFHPEDLATGVGRLLSILTLIFLAGCTANAPYRDQNLLSDPSSFGGYIGNEPQQKSFYARTFPMRIRII